MPRDATRAPPSRTPGAPRALVRGRGAAALAIVGAAALFGTTGTAQALGPRAATALGVGAVRLLVGAVALAGLARALRPASPRRWRGHAVALAVGGAAVAAYQLCWFAGLRRTGVALGTIVGIGSGPVFAGLIHVLRARAAPSRAWLAGTALTVLGAALLAARGAGGVPGDAPGLAFMLGAGLSYAVYTQAGKRAIDDGLDPLGAMAGMFGAGAALLAPVLLVEPLGWLGTGRGAAMGLHLGVLTVTVAYWLYGWGLDRLAVPTVVTLTLAEPLTAALLGVAFLGERLGPHGWGGAAAIAAGLALAGRGERDASTAAIPSGR